MTLSTILFLLGCGLLAYGALTGYSRWEKLPRALGLIFAGASTLILSVLVQHNAQLLGRDGVEPLAVVGYLVATVGVAAAVRFLCDNLLLWVIVSLAVTGSGLAVLNAAGPKDMGAALAFSIISGALGFSASAIGATNRRLDKKEASTLQAQQTSVSTQR
jgi:hypothetical protein